MNFHKSVDKLFAGVCAGIAEKIGINPIIVRVLAVVLFFAVPQIILLYFIVLFFSEETESEEASQTPEISKKERRKSIRLNLAVIILCTLSGMFIAAQFGFGPNFDFLIFFFLISQGFYMVYSGIFSSAEAKKERDSEIAYGIMFCIAGILHYFYISDFNIISFSRITAAAAYLWPLIVIALSLNFMLPYKKVSLIIWLIVFVLVILFAVFVFI